MLQLFEYSQEVCDTGLTDGTTSNVPSNQVQFSLRVAFFNLSISFSLAKLDMEVFSDQEILDE